MQMSITKFKTKCTSVVREVATGYKTIEITKRGKVVALVEPPPVGPKGNPAWGLMKGTVLNIADDFDEPLGDKEWESGR